MNFLVTSKGSLKICIEIIMAVSLTYRWLAKDEDDNKICKDLFCTNTSSHTSDLVSFETEVRVGKKPNSDSNTNIFKE